MEGSESAVNAPHPDGEDEAELFFGGDDEEDGGEETAAAEAAEAAAADDAIGEEPSAEPQAEESIEEDKPAEPAAADPTPPAASAGPTEDPTPPASGGASSSATGGDAEPKKSGQLEREYVVLHRVPLTKAALEHLLKEVTDGKDARVAFLEVERRVGRNDRQAMGVVYKAHRAQLGSSPKMVAVSARSFKERTVKPREKPVEEALEIS